MAKTEIMTRAYCSEFVICTKRAINTIEEAEAYVRKEIMDTAMVIQITIKEEGVERVIRNENYTDPSIINLKRV